MIAAFRVARIGTTGAFRISSSTCRNRVPPHSDCTIALAMAPKRTGNLAGSLFVNGADRSRQSVQLDGLGVAAPTVAPGSVSFPTQKVGTRSAGQRVTVTNPMNAILQVSTAVAGDFLIISNGCGTMLQPRSNCAIQVAFRPNVRGRRARAR